MSTPDLLRVDGLGLATAAGPVLTDLTFVVPRGRLTAVVGPSGSGRSALLLALSGRMRGLTGSVRHGEHARTTRARDLRARTSLARLATLVQPEGRLSVGESLTERALVDGVPDAEAQVAVRRAEAVLGTTLDRARLVDDLDAHDRALLCVALALVRPSDLVLLDDVDRDLDLADQRRLLAALDRLCATGQTVLVSTTEAAALPAGTHVVPLAPHRAPAPAPAPTTSTTPLLEKTS